jgi:hypothetical protein
VSEIMELTYEELTRRIAELREPMPRDCFDEDVESNYTSELEPWEERLSDGGEWFWFRGSDSTCKWVPHKPYQRNPVAAVELLEEIRASGIRCAVQTVHARGVGLVWRCEVRDSCAVEHINFCTSVSLAWLQWKIEKQVKLKEKSEVAA